MEISGDVKGEGRKNILRIQMGPLTADRRSDDSQIKLDRSVGVSVCSVDTFPHGAHLPFLLSPFAPPFSLSLSNFGTLSYLIYATTCNH